MLHGHIAQHLHIALRQNVVVKGFAAATRVPGFLPGAQCGANVLQTAQREQIGAQHGNDVIRTKQNGAVDGAQIGADVEDHDVGFAGLRALLGTAPEGGEDVEGATVHVHRVRVGVVPLLGELVFKGRQQQIPSQ